MYDASLDAFVKHDWSFNLPSRGQQYHNKEAWNGWLLGVASFNTYQHPNTENYWYGSGLPRYDELSLYGINEWPMSYFF